MTIYHGESWVSGPGTRKLDPEDRDDAITDVARDLLAADLQRYALRSVALCAGCDLLVHHTDLTTHARECEPLRALAAEAVDD